jgi:hypothetical protein
MPDTMGGSPLGGTTVLPGMHAQMSTYILMCVVQIMPIMFMMHPMYEAPSAVGIAAIDAVALPGRSGLYQNTIFITLYICGMLP